MARRGKCPKSPREKTKVAGWLEAWIAGGTLDKPLLNDIGVFQGFFPLLDKRLGALELRRTSGQFVKTIAEHELQFFIRVVLVR